MMGATLPRERPVCASVAATKIARREGAAKDSRKLGAASAGDTLNIVELLRTQSGTLRAHVADGSWVTATTSEGKRLLHTDADLNALLKPCALDPQPEPGLVPEPEPECVSSPRCQQARRIVKRKATAWAPPQDAAARSAALASSRDAVFDPEQAPWLQQCLLQCCKPLRIVSKNDWLAKNQPGYTNGDRNGQSYAQFCRPGPRRSFPAKFQKIYLTALGEMENAPDIAVLVECLRAHFQMDVVVAAPVVGDVFDALEKDDYGYLETPSCHALLANTKHKPRDCFANIGFTMEPLCDSKKGFEVLAGQARPDMGVGIFSFACYESKSPLRFLRRCCMVLVHEMTHLFGLKHCIHAACLMNGVNHLDEADRRPFAVCPICVAKFRDGMRGVWPTGQGEVENQGAVDPLMRRERDVLQFLQKHGMEQDARLSQERLKVMTT